MVPRVGCSNPAIIRSTVVFPDPDGPSMEKNSPSAISRSTPSTARTDPKSFARSTNRIDGVTALSRMNQKVRGRRAVHKHNQVTVGAGVSHRARPQPVGEQRACAPYPVVEQRACAPYPVVEQRACERSVETTCRLPEVSRLASSHLNHRQPGSHLNPALCPPADEPS